MHQFKMAILTIWRTAFLRNLFILSVGIVVLFPTVNRVFIYPLFKDHLITDTQNQAVRVAEHLALDLTPGPKGLTTESLSPSLIAEMPHNLETLDLWKVKIFARHGETLFSSDQADVGKINTHSYFLNEVASGQVVTKVARKDTMSLEGQLVPRDVVETYVPISHNSQFQGAFEIYYDITARLADLDHLLFVSQYVLIGVAVALFAVLIGALVHAAFVVEKRHLAEQAHLEAMREAEKANRAKSEFLASMSHDLRTPLNAIMGFNDMMRQKALGPIGNERYEGYIEDIHQSGSLLINLINDILDLSKIEAGKYELTNEPVSIPAVVDVAIRQLTTIANMSDLTLSNEIAPDLPYIIGDERAIVQVLSNLLSNAIKFTPGGGMITVMAYRNEDQSISISVKDTGMGMTSEGILKALQPFEQADGMHSRQHEGTGLGLHLCANLMKLFEGTLHIDSDLGEGTTVTVSFPSNLAIAPAQ